MQQYLFRLWSKHKSSIIAMGAILLLYLLMFAVGITCPIRFFSGISCPGCGMTRAYLSAVHLNFSEAFSYHPLWVAVPFATFFLVFFKIRNKSKAFYALLFTCVAAMLTVYLFRMLFTESEVVVCSPSSGFVYRCIQRLTALFHFL